VSKKEFPIQLNSRTNNSSYYLAILVPREEKARAFHEEEKRLQKFPRVTNLNRNGGAI
jgi:hypothetical protein